MNALVGQKIGKYEVVELLGSGGMAQVYRAIQEPLGRAVALKILHPHLTDPEIQDRFLREAKAVASLEHDNIVQVYDFDRVNGQTYIAMAYLEGQTLENYTKTKEGNGELLPATETFKLIEDVALALDFAHQQGIVHRDVKPANIMVTPGGRAILTDFGIAALINETRLTVDGGSTGTPSYMSPEQAMGDRGDARSDLYSLGAVFYRLATGRLPFESDTVYGLMMKHINDPLPPPRTVWPALSTEVESILFKTLTKDPQQRYQTAGELIADLRAFQVGEPLQYAQPSERARQQCPFPGLARLESKWLVGIAAGLLIALVLGGVFFLRAGGISPQVAASTKDGIVVKSMTTTGEESAVVRAMTVNYDLQGGFTEDFDDNELDWNISDGPLASQLLAGTYQVTVTEADRVSNVYPSTAPPYQDFVYEAEAALVEGQPESGYGLVFRRQDAQNYYVFALNGLSQWSVWRLQDAIWQELRHLPNNQTWTFSELVLPQGETNRLKVEAQGEVFQLYINDQPLLAEPLRDDTFATGDVGFYVASSRTASEALTRVQFDNVVLRSSSTDDR